MSFDCSFESNKDMQGVSHQLEEELLAYLEWLQESALARWATCGIADSGASIEQFQFNGAADEQVDLRVRVQLRQVVAFALAHSQHWVENGSELVTSIRQYLDTYGVIRPLIGAVDSPIYAHTLDASGAVTDQRQDLYDLAFQLLSYACCHHAFGDSLCLRRAESLFSRINQQFANPHGGWSEGDYRVRYRRQNPHMHLFEAFLMLYQTSGDLNWMSRANQVYRLFLTHFYRAEEEVVLEYFNDDWSLPMASQQIIEPGHMMEWVWLLRQYQSISGIDVEDICRGLYHRALAYGRSEQNVFFDQLLITGEVIKNTKRCWPMTEWVKASLAQASFADDEYDYLADAVTALRSLKMHYLTHPIKGQYIDQLGEDNQPINVKAPTSSLYHLVMCGLEGMRYLQSDAFVLQRTSVRDKAAI